VLVERVADVDAEPDPEPVDPAEPPDPEPPHAASADAASNAAAPTAGRRIRTGRASFTIACRG
jgi:hypothetical protein